MEKQRKITPTPEPPPPGPAEPAKPPVGEPEQGPPVRDPVRKKGPAGDPDPHAPPPSGDELVETVEVHDVEGHRLGPSPERAGLLGGAIGAPA